MNETSSAYWQSALRGAPPYFVGVVNVTPDSFSDGGEYLNRDQAVAHARELVADGAHIIEVGGESTRPGALPITEAEEQERILPVIEAIAREAFISVDTYKAKTARLSLEAGARMINDVSALRADPEMRDVLRMHGAPVVLMHSKESGTHPHVTAGGKEYRDIIQEASAFLRDRINFAIAGGVPAERIVVDPGMGRFLSPESKYSWELLLRFHELGRSGIAAPLLIAASRKGFLGGTLDGRDVRSQLAALIAVSRGATFVRTHNVRLMREFWDAWRAQ